MSKFQVVFKLMDNALFDLMEQLKNSEITTKTNQQILQLGPSTQKIINQSINLVLFALPILIVVFLFLSNWGIRSDINTKKDIHANLNLYKVKVAELNGQKNSLVSPRPIANSTALQGQLTQTYTRVGISPSKMTTTGFKQDSSLKSVVKTTAKLRFKNVTLGELTGLLNSLLSEYKMILTSINIKLIQEDSTLSGSLDISHFSNAAK